MSPVSPVAVQSFSIDDCNTVLLLYDVHVARLLGRLLARSSSLASRVALTVVPPSSSTRYCWLKCHSAVISCTFYSILLAFRSPAYLKNLIQIKPLLRRKVIVEVFANFVFSSRSYFRRALSRQIKLKRL